MAKLKIASRYATVPNELLNDNLISLKSKGMYAFIQSKPENWEFSAEKISRLLREGLPSVKSSLQELEENGYLARRRYQNSKGFWEVEYILFENPKVGNPTAENLTLGNPMEEFPTSGKPSNNTKQESTNKESIKSIIENKKNDFRNFIDSHSYLLGDQYESFFEYWTESNQKNGKLRWEDQKFFNIERRISTWMANKNKFNKNDSETKLGTSAARMAALRNF
jgi:hypothetical protein